MSKCFKLQNGKIGCAKSVGMECFTAFGSGSHSYNFSAEMSHDCVPKCEVASFFSAQGDLSKRSVKSMLKLKRSNWLLWNFHFFSNFIPSLQRVLPVRHLLRTCQVDLGTLRPHWPWVHRNSRSKVRRTRYCLTQQFNKLRFSVKASRDRVRWN